MSNERKTPLLCLKTKVPAVLFNGCRTEIKNPPIEKDGTILIPAEALSLAGVKCAGEYATLDSLDGLYCVYKDMGLVFLDTSRDFLPLNTEKDLTYILSLAHSFIFEIKTDKLGREYRPATEEERAGFMRVGNELTEMLLKRNNTHPFVLGSQEVFDKLRSIYTGDKNTEEYKLIADLIAIADRFMSKFPALNEKGDGLATPMNPSGYGEGEYDVGGRHSESEGRLTEISYFAFAYQMTLDTKYAKVAYYCSLSIIEREHWGPGHFLNCSGATGRLTMIYDWLYNVWKELKLDTGAIKKGIYMQGLRHGFNSTVLDTCLYPSPKQGTGWRFKLKPDNWNSVCNSGMILGSLCLLNEGVDDVVNEEMYNEIKELLGACITSTMDPSHVFTQYAPDGSYVESNSYWAYGTTNLVTSMVALRDSLGTDLGLHYACGFDKTCYYAINSESADFIGWNYHDGGLGSQNTSCFNPVAYLSGDAQLSALRKNHIDMGKEVTTLDLLYHPAARGGEVPELAGLSLDYAMEGIDAFTVRNGWKKGSLFAGIIGGENPAGGSHNQIDSGAFVYHNLGKMWFCDLGSDYYNSRGIANGEGYFSNYALYRRNAEGNNTLALTSLPFGQLLGKRGVMTECKSGNTASYAIIDNTDVYGADKVNHATRGMLLTNDRSTLVIKDEVEFADKDSAFTTAHFEVKKITAEVSEDKKHCTLTHVDGPKIYVSILGDGELEVMDCAGLLNGTAPAEGEYSREDFARLVVKYENLGKINTSFVIDTNENSNYKENISIKDWCKL